MSHHFLFHAWDSSTAIHSCRSGCHIFNILAPCLVPIGRISRTARVCNASTLQQWSLWFCMHKAHSAHTSQWLFAAADIKISVQATHKERSPMFKIRIIPIAASSSCGDTQLPPGRFLHLHLLIHAFFIYFNRHHHHHARSAHYSFNRVVYILVAVCVWCVFMSMGQWDKQNESPVTQTPWPLFESILVCGTRQRRENFKPRMSPATFL